MYRKLLYHVFVLHGSVLPQKANVILIRSHACLSIARAPLPQAVHCLRQVMKNSLLRRKKASSHETLPMRGCFDSGRAPLPSRNALLFIFSSTKKASTVIGTGFQAGDPREIRTPDTLIRSQVLYPAELLGHVAGAEGLKPPTYGFGDRCSINCAMPLSV